MFSKFFKGSGSHGSSVVVRTTIAGAALAAAACVGLAGTASASVVTWGSPTDVSGNADVSTAGTLVSAYNFYGTTPVVSPVVNGVTFTGLDLPANQAKITFGGDTLASTASMSSYANYGAPSNFSSEYQTLLTSAFYSAGTADPFTLTLNNLTPGANYNFEVWVNDARSLATDRAETVSSGNSVSLAFNTGTLGAGQFVLGTFTADSTAQQVITFTGNSNTGAQINGFQLRVVPVPEPATLGLVAVGGLGLLLLGKRRRV